MPLFGAKILLTPSFIKSIRTINFTGIFGTNVAQGYWGKGIFIIHFWFNNRLELKDQNSKTFAFRFISASFLNDYNCTDIRKECGIIQFTNHEEMYFTFTISDGFKNCENLIFFFLICEI